MGKSWISEVVIEKVKNHLEKKDQVLFFLNRRGFAPFVICKNCHDKFICPNCSVNLNYHKKNRCGANVRAPFSNFEHFSI